jgi:hypothetical protein
MTALVQKAVASGEYASGNKVVYEALRRGASAPVYGRGRVLAALSHHS